MRTITEQLEDYINKPAEWYFDGPPDNDKLKSLCDLLSGYPYDDLATPFVYIVWGGDVRLEWDLTNYPTLHIPLSDFSSCCYHQLNLKTFEELELGINLLNSKDVLKWYDLIEKNQKESNE